MARSSSLKRKTVLALTAMMLLFAPYVLSLSAWAVDPVTPEPPTAPSNAAGTAPAASGLTDTDTQDYHPPSTNTISETAEQNNTNVVAKVNQMLLEPIATRQSGRNTETYNGMAAWFGDDMISNMFANIGQLIGRWLSEFIDGWISSTVQFLAAFLRTFVLNPNIAVNGVQNTPGGGGAPDDISPYVREAAGTMYGIAIDLLLLLFILCIWKFWAEAAWRGGGHIFGSVGRLIFTAGLMLAWPTIYAFEIQITNEMIKAIYFSGGDQITQLDVALTAAVKAGLVGTTGLLANAFAPVIGGAVAGAAGGAVGGIVAFAGLVIYLILGVVLITQIVYILVLKAIQTGLLTAQYMFAPIFLVFFATPDTENVTSGFVRSFVEVSLWTFVWVGLLKIMVIILYSQFNPWGKITMAVGILQIMIQVPTFLARAQISPMSDFISAGLVTGGLMKGASALANKAAGAMTQFSKYVTGDMYGARGMPTSKKVAMKNTPDGAANPQLMNNLSNAGVGVNPGPNGKKGGTTTPGTPGQNLQQGLGKKPANPNGVNPAAGTAGVAGSAAAAGLGPGGVPLKTPGAGATTPVTKSGKTAAGLTAAGVAAAATMAAAGANSGLNSANAAAGQKQDPDALDKDEAAARKKLDAASAAMPQVGATPPKPKAKTPEELKKEADAANNPAANNMGATVVPATGVPSVTPGGKKQTKTAGGGVPTGVGVPTTKPPVGLNADTTGANKPNEVTARNLATGDKPEDNKEADTTVKGEKVPTPPAGTTKPGKPGDAKVEKGAEAPPAAPLDASNKGALPLASIAAMGTARLGTRANAAGRQGAQGQQGRGLETGRDGATGATTGKPNETLETARAIHNAGSEEQQQGDTRTVVNTETGKTPTPPGGKPGAQVITPGLNTGADGSNVTGVTGAPNLAIPLVPTRLPGQTAQAGRRGQGQNSAGGRAVEQASNGPRINNGQVDPLAQQVAVHVPAGAVDEDAAALNAARMGVQVIPGAGRGAGGHGGGPRQLSMPNGGMGTPPGGGGGHGGGGDGGATPGYVQFNGGGAPNGPTRNGRPIIPDGMTAFDQSNYRWVPGRNLLTDIRTAAGPQQGDAADGQAAISLGVRGISSVRYGQGASTEQKALMLMTAGYAGVFAQDPVAFDAARQSAIDAGGDAPKGFAQRIAANWLQYSGGSFKSTAIAKNQFQQTLMEQATTGAESYVNGQQGNAYTSYLRGRYGAMTSDQQAWGVHITSDKDSPESGWSTTVQPATATLVNAGMPITAENRAAASNQAVMRQPQWARGQAVRGVAAYLGAVADETLGPNAHPLERDAFVGRLAPQLSSETVEACRAIVAEAPNGQGAALCARPDYVHSVASLISSPESPRKLDASTAYRNLAGVMRGGSMGSASGTQMVDVLSAGGGGGFGGGGFTGGPSVPPAPPMGGGQQMNAVIDAQYRDMMNNGGGGNFNAGTASVYAPSNGILGNTIVRGPSGLGFANQTVHGTLDVLATQSNNNINLPNNLAAGMNAGVSQTNVELNANVINGGGGQVPTNFGAVGGANMTQRTDVNMHVGAGNDDEYVHNIQTDIVGTAGRQEMILNGGLSNSDAVNYTTANVYAEVVAPNGPANLPPLGQFSNMQDVRTETTANVSMGGGSGGGGGGTYVQQGLAQVYLNPTAGGNQQSSYLTNAVAQMGAQAAQSYASNSQSAQQIVIEMMRAGFDDNAIQNPQIAAVAMQTYQQDPSMLGSAAIASKVMQPQEVTTQTVQVVQQMVDAGWSPKSITRPDVLTSQMIIQSGAFGGAPGGGYPDPQHVRQVRNHPNFVPEYTRQAAARGAFNQIPSDLMSARDPNARGGWGGDRY